MTTENTKPTFTLLSGKKVFDPAALAQFFEKLTGRKVTEEEMKRAQQKFDAHKRKIRERKSDESES